jgi:Domain of unknown function (DUF1848)
MPFQGWEKTGIVLPDGHQADAIAPVIISASRATDIPAFFPLWFSNRLKAGYVRWTNPFNAKQVQYLSFKKTRVIVFWSKNPRPLFRYLPEIEEKGINSYFQFTINDYEKEGLEPNLPPLLQRVETFKALVEKIGKERVIWRFDPLILSDAVTIDLLIDRISLLADLLQGYTEKLVISFADIRQYRHVQNNLARQQMNYREFTVELMTGFAERLNQLNRQWGLKIATCAEEINLLGIEHNRCIDDTLLVELFRNDNELMNFLGYSADLFGERPSLSYSKDKGQRKACGCIVSKDIGMYNTCNHLCAYCYANRSGAAVQNNLRMHNPASERLIS